MVKDEIDILPTTIKHMLTQVDKLLILDDNSSDGTYEYLSSLASTSGPLYLLDPATSGGVFREGYYQSAKMTTLAMIALDQLGADWVVPFDADELWTSQWGTIKEVCENHEDTYGIIRADLFDHMVTGSNDCVDVRSPVSYMQWRRVNPLPLPKVACRATTDLVIEQGNHGARYNVPARMTEQAPIVVHHYPYRSHEQFIRKVRNGAAAYAKTDLPETAGAHWRQWGKFTDEQLVALFDTYYYVPDPTQPYFIDGIEQEQPALYKDPFHV